MRYEVKIATGLSILELENDINRIVDIRNQEITNALKQGYDVISYEHEYFKPCGQISFVDGKYTLALIRKKIYENI